MKRDEEAVEVFLALGGHDVRVGRLTREPRRVFEAVGFSYAEAWLEHPDRYALQPGLVLAPGTYAPPAGRAVFGAIVWVSSCLARSSRSRVVSETRSAAGRGFSSCDAALRKRRLVALGQRSARSAH